MNYINGIRIYGEVISTAKFSHEYSDVPYYLVIVKARRCVRDKIVTAIVRTYFSAKYFSDSDLPINSKVIIDGTLVNSKINKEITNISVVVDKCTIVESFDENSSTTFAFSGEITKMFTTPENYKGFVNFVIANFDDQGKKISSARIVIKNKLSKYVLDNYKIGDKVIVKGFINNPKPSDDIYSTPCETIGYYITKYDEEDTES